MNRLKSGIKIIGFNIQSPGQKRKSFSTIGTLASKLEPFCEVFEVKSDNTENCLGIISGNAMVYIAFRFAIKFLEYKTHLFPDRFVSKEETRLRFLLSQHIESNDKDILEMYYLSKDLFESPSTRNQSALYPLCYVAKAIYSSSSDLGFAHDISQSLKESSNSFNRNTKASVKQGKFVVSFLKSKEYLFYL